MDRLIVSAIGVVAAVGSALVFGLICAPIIQKQPNGALKNMIFRWIALIGAASALSYAGEAYLSEPGHPRSMTFIIMPCWFALALTIATLRSRTLNRRLETEGEKR